jgi:hypothetical protein
MESGKFVCGSMAGKQGGKSHINRFFSSSNRRLRLQFKVKIFHSMLNHFSLPFRGNWIKIKSFLA